MVNYKKIVLKGNCKEKCPSGPKITFPLCFLRVSSILRQFIFGNLRVAKMVNYKKIVLKGNCEEKCPGGQKNNFPLCFNKVFIDFEAFISWPCEGSENGKTTKK